jgi:hypothetical protein
MDATSEAAFLPPGCLPSVVLGPAVLPLVPGLKPGQAEPPGRSPGPGPAVAAHGGARGSGHLAVQHEGLPVGAWYRLRYELFLRVLLAVRKTVSNIPVSMVAVIGRQVRTMSRHCLTGGSLQACSRATARRCCCSFHDYWRRRRAGKRMPRVSKAALSIGLSLPDGHLVRNAAWFP